ncbi:hypothetical protein [Adhaeribacter terreus]|uniref:Uncharacterized protein n=1 Tax=Adhaeribacter terreus TaxID=529703 RepID=A0ABW0EAE9_9BACT
MLNASKTQLILPIPPASHLLMFVLALCLAGIMAFVQHQQISKPKAKNAFLTGHTVAKTLTISKEYAQVAVR